MNFQVSPLNIDKFSRFFGQDSETLSRQGVKRVTADIDPGYPCRVSLQDAKVGEHVLLMNFEHQPKQTPFRSSHAIYIREAAASTKPKKNEIPQLLRHRLLSVRAFDTAGMMVDADVIEGERIESLIERMFANERADYLHIHNAKPGCYLVLVERG